MTLHHFLAIALLTGSLASAHHSTTATRRFSTPVQPTAFPNDPALTTPRPLVILTPSESGYDDVESTSSSLLIDEASIIPFQDIDPTEIITPIPFIPRPSSTPPSSPSSAWIHHAERQVAPSSSPSLTTLTGTHATKPSSTSNPASVPTAFANAAVGLIAIVGLAMAL